MNKQDKKKLASTVELLKRAGERITELLRKEQGLLDLSVSDLDTEAEPRYVIEANVQCLSEMSDDLAEIGEILMNQFVPE